jgi:hypothetical protein
MGVRVEVATSGFDEYLQGYSSDPYGGAIPGTTGLRIPPFRQDDTTRYLFLLCSRVVAKPTRIRGIRQLLTVGFTVSTPKEGAANTVAAYIQPVESPTFRAPDGNVSWHLVNEPNPSPNISTPNQATLGFTEGYNFAYRQSDGPALLTDAGTAFGAFAGQTVYYTQNMTAYQPPVIGTSEWQPLGGLGNMHDIRFPWLATRAWDALDIPLCAQSTRRVSLYASVLQTNGLPTLESTPTGTTTPYWGPELAWAQLAAGIAAADGDLTVSATQFYSVGGAIVFEDYDCGCGESCGGGH